tara:strand:+ start:209 stop:877 length:669 start_codon:yes stop_codon:yes gene_type:complete
MKLQEQYARLFKGKPMSNDTSLITEAPIKVLRHGQNGFDDLVFHVEVNGKKFSVITGKPSDDWAYYQRIEDPNKPNKKVTSTALGPNIVPTIEKYVKDNEYEINRVYGMEKYTGKKASASSGPQGPLKIYGSGPGKIEVKDYDDMRERDPEFESGFEGELEFEGTWDGEKWTATKEYLGDGAIFTTVYDANGDNVEDESIDAYDEIIDAINDYMEEEGLASE